MVTANKDAKRPEPPKLDGRTQFVKQAERVGVTAAIALALLGAAYGFGRYQTASRIDQVEQDASQARQQAQREFDGLKAQMQDVQQKLVRLEARRRLHLALMALDARNFGIAQTHLDAAKQLLLQSKPADGTALAKLAGSIGELKIVASEDVSAERQRILGFVDQFDAAMPPMDPSKPEIVPAK